jgi:hypothetical protein
MNNLPSIDRVKIGRALKCARQDNGIKNGQWIPREKMTKSQLALDIFIFDLINRIINGEFDEVKI